ncbi:MAG TPA: activase, partial [Sarcina sp.]|nr:activase [Sarcina sp.]
GLPFVLAYWETLPFWRTFWRSLGFDVLVSPESTRAIYEDGLHAVTSDTECFPGKLVHGHIRWLESHGADRIFFPSISTRKSENTEKTSVSMCGIVKGFPFVIKNSDNPEGRGRAAYDAPVFFWYTDIDRERQLSRFMLDTFGIKKNLVKKAIREGNAAQAAFSRSLLEQGKKVLDKLEKLEADRPAGNPSPIAVVLAARPYQNDDLVN